jgi:DNA-binding transcriptional LysR family regulator
VIKRLVGAGFAVSAVPLASVEQQLEQKSLVSLKVQGWPLQRNLLVVRHVHKYISPALAEFLEIMRSELRPRLAAP